MAAYLVVDTRERFVLPFIKTDFISDKYIVHQINTGDYLICRSNTEIIVCIERKTLKDFASSFKDGRYENRKKMINLRNKSGCKLFFFVEGPAFPKPSRLFSRIPYKNILASMTSMMLRDEIYIVLTENQAHTSKRLLQFIQSINKNIPKIEKPKIENLTKLLTDYDYDNGRDSESDGERDCNNDNKTVKSVKSVVDVDVYDGGADAADNIVSNTVSDSYAVPVEVMGCINESDDTIVTNMWAKLGGITVVSGNVLMSTFSIHDFISGGNNIPPIKTLKMPNNKIFRKPALISLNKLLKGDLKTEIKLLSGIPGISLSMASTIINTSCLKTLLSSEESEIKTIKINGRLLGPVRTSRIFQLFNFNQDCQCP